MDHPVNNGTYLARQTIRTGFLLAGNAWDIHPTEHFVSGFDRMTLTMEYTPDAAVGYVDWYLEYSIDSGVPDEWHRMTLYGPGGVAAGADSQSDIAREYIRYTPTQFVTTEPFTYGPIEINGIERIRLVAREDGAVADEGAFVVKIALDVV